MIPKIVNILQKEAIASNWDKGRKMQILQSDWLSYRIL